MKNTLNIAVLAGALALSGALAAADAIPARPEQIASQPLAWTPPAAKDHRVVLKKSGVVAYLAENHDLPLVNVQILLKGGTYLKVTGGSLAPQSGGTGNRPFNDVWLALAPEPLHS